MINGLILLPSVVTGESFDVGHTGVAVENFILLFEYLKRLLSGFILVCGSVELLDEGFLSDDVIVLFNNIRMSGREALF